MYDITGAGDMVLSVIGFGLAGGLEYPRLIELANLAGRLEVEKLGVVPLTREDLMPRSSRDRLCRRKHMELATSCWTSWPNGGQPAKRL